MPVADSDTVMKQHHEAVLGTGHCAVGSCNMKCWGLRSGLQLAAAVLACLELDRWAQAVVEVEDIDLVAALVQSCKGFD